MPHQRVAEEVKTDRIIWYTIQLEPIGKLQLPGKVHPRLLILEAMKLDGGCYQLNLAWLDLEVIWWNGRIQDDGADVSDLAGVVDVEHHLLGELDYWPESDSPGEPAWTS
ncbi:unnamed protein product [Linum trigynum]|uniref:Uncharacterized protein n=1 Tax=Linum trigynum TaxID=586398 RepID=A0AAV2G9P6_9ROSI